MKYLIVGTGGVGGSIAGFLALAGKDVTCIARGRHLEAIRRNGLHLKSDLKGEHYLPVTACTSEEFEGKADVIFVCVKGYSIDSIKDVLERASAPGTLVIPILNVYGTGPRIGRLVPSVDVLDGCIYIVGFVSGEGEITQMGSIFRMVFGARPEQGIARERLEEIDDPEQGIERLMEYYHSKGYSANWINQRLKSIEVRKELTDEWERRGIQKGRQYAILTDVITQGWSGLSTKQYKQYKGLKTESLRDNMTNLELVLNMLAEASTTEISQKEEPETFEHSKQIAHRGGKVAGAARKELEAQTGQKVVSPLNAKKALKK